MPCGDKRKHRSKADAEAARQRLIEDDKQTGRAGKSWKRLNSYLCRDCGFWHVGRTNKLPAGYKPPQPIRKIPTIGQLRRKLERLEVRMLKQDDYWRRQRAEMWARIIAAEQISGKTDRV